MLRKISSLYDVTWLIVVELSWHSGGLLWLAYILNPHYWIIPVPVRKLRFYAPMMMTMFIYEVLWTWNWRSEQMPYKLNSWQWSFSSNAVEIGLPCILWKQHSYTTSSCWILHQSKYCTVGGQIETTRCNKLSDELLRQTVTVKHKYQGMVIGHFVKKNNLLKRSFCIIVF